MPKLNFLLSILIVSSLFAGCAPKATAQSEQVKVPENSAPTDVPTKPTAAGPEIPALSQHTPPASCAVTIPQNPPFSAPAPYSANAPWPNQFWYGSTSLWTVLPTDGTWSSLPHDEQGYGQKVFWWREGYSASGEPQPALTVTGERLDGESPALYASGATNASARDIGDAMLIGVEFPTLGCWKVTGHYKDSKLSFVIWVAP